MDKATAEKMVMELVDAVESLTKKEMGPGEPFKPGKEFNNEPDTSEEKRLYYAVLSGLRSVIEALTTPQAKPQREDGEKIIDAAWAAGYANGVRDTEEASKPAEPFHDDDSRRTPKGFKKIEAYTDYKIVVIMGDPYVLDGDNHNCDAMGCGSMGHVMARLPILPEDTTLPTDRLLEAAKAVLDWYDVGREHMGPELTFKNPKYESLRQAIEAIEKATQGGNDK
jgi:hypothetical protein